jgi:hypothetical protein
MEKRFILKKYLDKAFDVMFLSEFIDDFVGHIVFAKHFIWKSDRC